MRRDRDMEETYFFGVYTYKQLTIWKGDTIKLWSESRKRVDDSVQGD